MLEQTGRFGRSDRLLKSRDYKRVASRGERLAGREFVLLLAPTAPEGARKGRVRLGVTASRRVGNAVVRNRVKRSVKNWFRVSRGHFKADSDLLVIARPDASALSPKEVEARLAALVARWEKKKGTARS